MQDTTINSLHIIIGDATKKALVDTFQTTLDCITIRMVSCLTNEQVDTMNCTQNTKTRIKGFIEYTKLLQNENTLNRIRINMTCPILLTLPSNPFVTPCCGKVFERTALFTYLKEGNLQRACPLCKIQLQPNVCFQQNNPTALKDIIHSLQNA